MTFAEEQRSMTMFGITEDRPGPKWRSLFEATWGAYRRWYLSEGSQGEGATDGRPDLATCEAALVRYMPELVPTWRRLVTLTGENELAARMLTLWDPPAFAPGCAQLVLARPERMLIRNYDYSPELFEQVVYSSRFTGGRVLGTGDCLWGLLDGMNDDGLVVSFTFGGRPGSGPGFAISLVVRYLLEVCATVEQARAVMERLPVSMAYNVTISDRTGATVTVFVAPGVPAEFFDTPLATNHKGLNGQAPEHPDLARALNSVERQDALLALVQSRPDSELAADAFLRPPLYNTAYSRGFGTLYTAVFLPDAGVVEYRWPDTSWRRAFDSPDGTKDFVLREAGHAWSRVAWRPQAQQGRGSAMTGRTDEPNGTSVDETSVAELAEQARKALQSLAARPEVEAFQELLALSAIAGECVGESARLLAGAGSWSQVAEATGTTKQAAWSRWRG
jgi:predicted choloylglycine hydrolase